MILSYPITEVPLARAHSDGTMNKTEKAAFTKIFEQKQLKVPDEKSIGQVNATMFDGVYSCMRVFPNTTSQCTVALREIS